MTLGQLLKSKRSELGRSLEQISAATKIHLKILEALEEDRYADLPARAFTRGFIVTYCKALKLDPDQVLKEYHDFLESKFTERQNRDQGHQGYVFEGKELEQNKRWMVIGVTIAVLFMLAVLVIFKPQNRHRKEKHKEFVQEPSPTASPTETPPVDSEANVEDNDDATEKAVTEKTVTEKTVAVKATSKTSSAPIATPTASPSATPAPSTTATPATTPSGTPTASPTPKPDPLRKGDELSLKEVKRRILFRALDDVWVRYQADQKAPMMFILRKGRQLVIKAKDQLHMETNHPAALEYKTRGYQYLPLGTENFSVQPDGTLQVMTEGVESQPMPSPLPPTTP